MASRRSRASACKVQQGDFFALLGPNGAGKSTTIGIICSLVAKSGGKVSVFDVDIDQDFPAAKKYIGIVPQEFNFNQFETGAGYRGQPGRLLRPAAGTGPRAGREIPDGAGAVGQARRALAHVVRRHEAAPDDCPRPGARAETADPGRAHRRCRYRDAPLHVGFSEEDQRRRAPPSS